MPKYETNHATGHRLGPLGVLLGFLAGTAVATSFSLSGVAFIAYVLGSEYPRLASEMPTILVNLCLFVPLTVIAGLSFYAELTAKPWRIGVFVVLAAALAALGLYYWPD